MTTYKVAYKAATGEAQVLVATASLPTGFVWAGNQFDHDGSTEVPGNDPLDTSENHVLFQHVRDQLYFAGEQNMQRVTISVPATVAVTGVTVAPTTLNVGVGANSAALVPTVAPSGASNKGVTYSTSDATKATVNSSGVVHGVAAGTATITVTTVDGAKTATCVVTVA